MKTITIKLPPLLYEEVCEHTVYTGLVDHRAGNPNVGLSAADIRLYEQLERGSTVVCDLAEASELYDELYNLEDLCEQWAYEIGPQYYGVLRSIKVNKRKLADFGVRTNSHGWAVKVA